jgi:CheY-like chemotaxis protein
MNPDPLASAAQGLRVLVVEDEVLVAMYLEELLQAKGCTVLGPVSQVARALALLERERPDIALLDLNLYGERPTSVAEALNERGIPFVVCSGYGERLSEEPAFRNAPHLSKPVQAEILLHTLVERAARGASGVGRATAPCGCEEPMVTK